MKHPILSNRIAKVPEYVFSKLAKEVKEVEDKLKILASRKLNKESLQSILDRLFPKSEAEQQTRRENVLRDVMWLFEKNDNNAFPEVRGTAYNLLNSITEFVDHKRGTRVTDKKDHLTEQQARSESAIFGSGSSLKSQALEVIFETTSGAELVSKRTYYINPSESTGSSMLDAVLEEVN